MSCGSRLEGWRVAASDGIQISGFGTLTTPVRMSVLADTIVVGVVWLESMKYERRLC